MGRVVVAPLRTGDAVKRETEQQIEEARRRWPARFKARVAAMRRLLDRVPEDQTPMPRAAGDE